MSLTAKALKVVAAVAGLSRVVESTLGDGVEKLGEMETLLTELEPPARSMSGEMERDGGGLTRAQRAGFREVHGDEWFTGGYARTAWGVDDRAFLEQSTAMIGDLQTRDEPWFLTMLTVGTHHPYVVPADYRPRTRSPIARSLAYADEAVSAFDRKLEEMGVLADTLVRYASDESVGFDGEIQKLDQMIVKG